MSQTPSSDLGARVTQLERDLAAALLRIGVLEGRSDAPPAPVTAMLDEPAEAPLTTSRPADRTTVALVTLLGRSCIVIGGAFLIRALTEGGVWPGTAGVAIGLLYALASLVAADRTADRHHLSARVHAATAVLTAWPLVAEATVRLSLVTPVVAAILLGVLTTGAYIVAARRRLADLPGLAGAATVLVGLAIAMTMGTHGVVSLLFVALATATSWFAEHRRLGWLRWLTAGAAGLELLAVTSRALAVPPREPVWLALLSLACLVATIQGSLATRFILLGREARVFDAVQAAGAVVIGSGGAVLLTRSNGTAHALVGVVTLLFGLGAYLAGQTKLIDRPRMMVAYRTTLTFGLAATVVALAVLLDGTALAVVAAGLAVAVFAGASWPTPLAPPQHGLVFALTAVFASGLPQFAWGAWTSTPAPVWAVSPVAIAVMAVAGWCSLRPLPGLTAPEAGLITGTQLAVAGLTLFCIGGLLTAGFVQAGGAFLVAAERLASARTLVVAMVAIGTATLRRLIRPATLRRLVYPVLALGGVRILLDDLRHFTPSTLFFALAVFGLALAVAPRLAARVPTPAATNGSSRPASAGNPESPA